jgi:hypothetical protein
MSAIKLSTPSSGSISLSPADTASDLTITVPAVTATMATLTTPAFVSTIGVGGATPAASGAGITFPATQSASTDANTLDDYEEGTWTPVIAGGTTAGTYTYTINQAGAYTKIGRMVIATCSLFSITTSSAGSGTLTITGLPFTSSAADPNNRGLNFVPRLRFFSTTRNNIIAIVGAGSTIIFIGYDNNGSSGGVDYPVTDISSGSSQIGCTVIYYV